MFGRVTITLGIGPHSSVMLCYVMLLDHASSLQRRLRALMGNTNHSQHGSAELL